MFLLNEYEPYRGHTENLCCEIKGFLIDPGVRGLRSNSCLSPGYRGPRETKPGLKLASQASCLYTNPAENKEVQK